MKGFILVTPYDDPQGKIAIQIKAIISIGYVVNSSTGKRSTQIHITERKYSLSVAESFETVLAQASENRE